MNARAFHSIAIPLASAALFVACATGPTKSSHQEVGESVVFIGQQPASLAWVPMRGETVQIRSTYEPKPETIYFVEGQDFTVDYEAGTLSRTPGSRLPDFRTNMLFGQAEFDHSKFPGFGNKNFFAFIDYHFTPTVPWPVQVRQTELLKHTHAKLRSGAPVKIVAFGDSITAGGDASRPGLIFWMRWAEELRRKYPAADITAINGATGGDTTAQGLERLNAKVLDEHPDLVLVAFGMNDHNVPPFGVALPQFESNLKQMIDRIRQQTSAEVILISAFPPNPNWKFGSHRMANYAAATQRVARERSCAYADVYSNWVSLAARKKPEDLLANNINHPNDFGHWIYFRVLTELGL